MKSNDSNGKTGALELTAPSIEKHHEFFAKNIAEVVEDDVAIACPSGKNWARQVSNVVRFALMRRNGTQHVRTDQRLYPVISLRYDEGSRAMRVQSWWASWNEEWFPVGGGAFALKSAGWTIFCDLGGNVEDAPMVFRGEWGPMNKDGKPESRSGQPHWHTHNLPATYFLEPPEFGRILPPNSEEIPLPSTPDAVDISNIHLAMAGWTHPAPTPWHFPLSDGFPSALQHWARGVLDYIRVQLPYARSAYV